MELATRLLSFQKDLFAGACYYWRELQGKSISKESSNLNS